jgi:hypothetical protein
MFSILGKKENSKKMRSEYQAAFDQYMKAALAIFSGNATALKSALDSSLDDFLKVKKNQKTAFYFLRNCRDLSQRDTLDGAVTELLM